MDLDASVYFDQVSSTLISISVNKVASLSPSQGHLCEGPTFSHFGMLTGKIILAEQHRSSGKGNLRWRFILNPGKKILLNKHMLFYFQAGRDEDVGSTGTSV